MSSRIQKLTECSILIAVAVILNFIKFNAFWALGGSITAVSMLPVLLIGYRHGVKWGILGGMVYTTLQIIFDIGQISSWGLTTTVFIGTIVLDYLLAYGSLSLSGIFSKKTHGLCLASIVCLTLRYVFHVISGLVLFAEYDQVGFTPLTWSLAYNASYMLPEIIFTTVVAFLVEKIPAISGRMTDR